jgi:hypothetical protein
VTVAVWKPNYITSEELKDYRNIDDGVDDFVYAAAVTAASRAIDNHCNRQFGKTDEAQERAYTAWYHYELARWVVDIDDLQDATDLVVSIGGTAVTVFTLAPVNAVLDGMAWTQLVIGSSAEAQPCGALAEVLITANPWGWDEIPVPVVNAAYLQGSRFVSRRKSPYGIAGSPDQGSELRLLNRVDPDVGVSLRGYRRARKTG